MTNEQFWKEREQYQKAMNEELIRVQCEGEDRGYICAGRIDYEYSKFWFRVETEDYSQIHGHYFACKTLEDLRAALEWIVNDTKFYDVTAFVKGCSNVTFTSQKSIDMLFDSYYRW
ncbi:MAG: hypothetical protein LIO94_02310 [Clostridiales bacterium]|nr:hypothetical protein [Clostridiales bacterium]